MKEFLMINITIATFLNYTVDQTFENREDNMARLEGASNHKLGFINNIYIKFHEINPPNMRSYIQIPKNYLIKLQ